MFYCPKCGNGLKEYRKFCTFCGAKLESYKDKIQEIENDLPQDNNPQTKIIPSNNKIDYQKQFELYSDEQLKEVLASGRYSETAIIVANNILEERQNAKKKSEMEEHEYLKRLFQDYTDEQLHSIELNSSDYTETARKAASVLLNERKQAYVFQTMKQHDQVCSLCENSAEELDEFLYKKSTFKICKHCHDLIVQSKTVPAAQNELKNYISQRDAYTQCAFHYYFKKCHNTDSNTQIMSYDDENLKIKNEQEGRQMIDEYENEIVSAFADLKNAARNIGMKAYQAALDAQKEAVSNASDEKIKMMIFPVIIISIGVFCLPIGYGFVGVLLLIFGFFFAYNMNKKGNELMDEASSRYSSILNTVETEQKRLNSIVSDNSKI